MFIFAKQISYESLDPFLLHLQLGSGSPLFRPLPTPLHAWLASPLELGTPACEQYSVSQVARTFAPE